MPLSKYFSGQKAQPANDTPPPKAPTPKAKPAKRKTIGQRMAESAGY